MAKSNVSSLAVFLNGQKSLPVFVGIDVHKKSYHVAFYRSGSDLTCQTMPADPQVFIEMLLAKGIAPEVIAYEAGPTGFGLARELREAGYEVIVAAPSRIPRPVRPDAKTDRLDCLKLAELAAKGMLSGVAVPSEEEEAERSLARLRQQLVEDARKTKQRIKSLLLLHHQPEPAGLDCWSKKAVAALTGAALPREGREALAVHVSCLKFLQSQIRRVEAKIEAVMRKGRHEKQYACLRSVPGVGPVAASTFLLEMFRPGRFRRAEEVAGYLGLAPVVRQSGQGKARGRLMPVGQNDLRAILTEAVWRWKAKDERAQAIYAKVLARTGVSAKAVMALARRLAIILWRLCLEVRPYRPGLAV